MSKLVVILCVLVFAVSFGIGCSKSTNFGKEIAITNVTKIRDILSHLDRYGDKMVRVEGKITSECPSGGWFNLKDDTAEIYINLHPQGFAIPQRVGSKAVVEGMLKDEKYRIEIVGEGVQIQ